MALDLVAIQLIAEEVRQEIEQVAKQKGGMYANLCGLCAIASAELFKKLKKSGHSPRICFTYGHCFIRVGAYLVDVTATQFRVCHNKKIVIHRYRDIKSKIDGEFWFWDTLAYFSCLHKALSYQQEMGWLKDQWINI